ncbi:peptidase dimerization domain-containing protein [Ochrobactrum sp. WV_118_8]|uniref:peptidase dimerization domain-containing protein n=1 Tax=Brucella anthropi TaxID=529 RepID=UPI0031FA988A
MTVGTIHGGTGRNTVPEECRLQVDLRLPDSATADEILAKINAMTPEDLGGVDEFEPVSCGSNMNHADEALGELVVSSSNGAVDFQSAKHPFD